MVLCDILGIMCALYQTHTATSLSKLQFAHFQVLVCYNPVPVVQHLAFSCADCKNVWYSSMCPATLSDRAHLCKGGIWANMSETELEEKQMSSYFRSQNADKQNNLICEDFKAISLN